MCCTRLTPVPRVKRCIDRALSAQLKLLRRMRRQGAACSAHDIGAGGCVETDPVTDDTASVLKGLKSMAVNALVLEGFDEPLDHAVLLLGVLGDELLLQSIALDQGRVATAGDDQAVAGPQQERLLNAAEMPVAGSQGLFQGRLGGLGTATGAEVPSETLHMSAADRSFGTSETDGRASRPSRPAIGFSSPRQRTSSAR